MPLERRKPLPRVGIDEPFGWEKEVRVPLARRTPDAAAQLVEVCESEHLGVVNDYRVRPWNVYARFHYRRRE